MKIQYTIPYNEVNKAFEIRELEDKFIGNINIENKLFDETTNNLTGEITAGKTINFKLSFIASKKDIDSATAQFLKDYKGESFQIKVKDRVPLSIRNTPDNEILLQLIICQIFKNN